MNWLKQHQAKEGIYYVISSNPFIFYQQRVTELKFQQAGYKNNFIFKGLGMEAPIENYPKNICIGILMDNLARCLYVENEFPK